MAINSHVWFPDLGNKLGDHLGDKFGNHLGDLATNSATILATNSATILATWRQIWRLWPRNMGSQRCWNLLDISIRREDTLDYARRFHVTSLPAAGDLYKESAWSTECVLIHWERL
ncbi:hypothetical protein AVEN_198035-1 [Araneus ventricosus]|uniref:Uncharacterized protein n=1 Tax=Araneus ventricosus TaxID=182803 RepID=A0A4Y2GP12_ARAVE|nr:hypothetical protein AVEN_198035-1 [Araneus ventricosus]